MSNRKAEQSEATRARLLAAARELFATRGYSAVATEEIVRRAGVTRGALYHQFADKRDLFRAVFEQVDTEIVAAIGERALSVEDPFAGLEAGVSAWLDFCSEPEVQRIVLLDAPAVLGVEEWRAIGERTGLGLILAGLERAADAGAIEPQPLTPLAHVVVGMLDEAALYLARADDKATARRDMELILRRLLETLRPRPAQDDEAISRNAS